MQSPFGSLQYVAGYVLLDTNFQVILKRLRTATDDEGFFSTELVMYNITRQSSLTELVSSGIDKVHVESQKYVLGVRTVMASSRIRVRIICIDYSERASFTVFRLRFSMTFPIYLDCIATLDLD